MVCSKCQKAKKATELATPEVKKKNEIYLGSETSSKSIARDKTKPAATTQYNGIGKSKLLSKAARNPYAAYSSSCSICKTKTDQGKKFCQRCAYKENVCAMCGKAEKKKDGANEVVEGRRFSAK